MENVKKTSPKYLEARSGLPKELWPIYERLVEDYAFRVMERYGHNWVAYKVIADLVNDGWRPSK